MKISNELIKRAYDVVAQKVYNPVFCKTLTELGVPVTEANVGEYTKLAFELRSTLSSQGIDIARPPIDEQTIKAAAAFVSDDKEVKAAGYVVHNT
jgi:hypothetical protein